MNIQFEPSPETRPESYVPDEVHIGKAPQKALHQIVKDPQAVAAG